MFSTWLIVYTDSGRRVQPHKLQSFESSPMEILLGISMQLTETNLCYMKGPQTFLRTNLYPSGVHSGDEEPL